MNSTIGKLALKFGFLFLALVALVGGIVIPASAAPAATPNTVGFHLVQGEVQSIAAPSLVVLDANKQVVTLTTDSNSQYFIIPMGKAPGPVNKKMGSPNSAPNAQMQNLHIPANWRDDLGWLQIFNNTGSFSNLAAGDRVIVRADASNLAKQIMIIKAPMNRTIKGGIVLTDPTHITVTPAGAAAITLNVTATTQIILKGQTSISGYASVLYNSSNNNALTVNVQANAPTPTPVATIPPSVTLTSVAIIPGPQISLPAGVTQQFTAMANYSNGTAVNVNSQATWLSSDPSKATITSPGGLAKGIAAGTTNITASLSGVNSPAVVLTVSP